MLTRARARTHTHTPVLVSVRFWKKVELDNTKTIIPCLVNYVVTGQDKNRINDQTKSQNFVTQQTMRQLFI
jgi:hypothetical protein